MTRSHVVQSSFLTGVLDPRASARVETDAYRDALLVGDNVLLHHLGGAKRRPGLRYLATLPNVLVRYPATPTAPNGGTAANANDDDPDTVVLTTTSVSTNDPYVVVHYDLGAQQVVDFADVEDIICDTGSSTQFCIQYSTDDATWTTLGAAFSSVASDIERTYRRAGPVTARYWRVAKIGGTDMGSAVITLAKFNLWRLSDTVSNVRIIPFEVSTEERYFLAVTDRSGQIYGGGALLAEFPLPYSSAKLTEIDAANDAANMFVVHEDYRPRLVVRETPTSFQTVEIEFDSVPSFDFDDADSPAPAVDTHEITLAGTWDKGDTFQITVNGARTAAITYAGDSTADEQAASAANIAREVQKVYTVRAYTGVTCVRTGTGEYTVAFGGASADDYDVLAVSKVTGASGTATVVKTTTGSSRREPVWSDTRGYPRTVAFYEGRLFFGGTKQRQQTIFGSTVAFPLSFQPDEGLDDEAILTTLLGQNLNAIQGLYAGRSFQLFTSGGEFRYAKQQGQAITPSDAPANQTQYGAAKVRPVAIDGATLYVQRNRKSIRDFKYNYEEDAFDSLGVSALSPHLINDVRDMFSWNGTREDEISLVFVVNGDGTVAALNSRREANVNAWVRWTTQGLFKAGAAVLEDVVFAVQRTIDGVSRLFLEQVDTARYLDAHVRVTGTALSSVSGVSHLNNTVCKVRGDGYVLSDVAPTSGVAPLSSPSNDVEIGLWFQPVITPMPIQSVAQSGAGTSNFLRKRRIVKVRARVQDTLGLLINGKTVPETKYDIASTDVPVQATYSGAVDIPETTNWDSSEDKLVTFSQNDPLPMNVLGIDIQLESSQ